MKKKSIIIIFVIALLALIASSCVISEGSISDTSATDAATDAATTEENAEASAENVAYEITDNRLVLYTNSIGTVWMQGIVEITNTGDVDLYMSSGQFDIEDASGSLVDSKSMISVFPQIISPSEKAYYYMDATTESLDVNANYTIVPKVDAVKATIEKISLPVSELKIEESTYYNVNGIGRVENATDEEQTLVEAVVFMYDGNGKLTALAFTYINKMAAGEKLGFDCSPISLPDSVTIDSIASYNAVAYPQQYQFNF